jgi:hypothetical protein
MPKAYIGTPRGKVWEINSSPSQIQILDWEETHLSILAAGAEPMRPGNEPDLLVLQKTFLPGWKADVNGAALKPIPEFNVLTGVPLLEGSNRVHLDFEPVSLRLGFFLFFLMFGTLAGLAFKSLLA